MSDEIKELSATVNGFMLQTTEIFTRLSTNQELLTKSVDEMSKSSRLAIESNTRLEERLVSLEDRALDKLNLVEDSVNEIEDRVKTLELNSARKSGYDESTSNNRKAWLNKWQWALGVITVVIAAMSLLYSVLKTGVTP